MRRRLNHQMLRIIFFIYKMFFQIDSRSILAYGHKLPIFVLNRGLPKKMILIYPPKAAGIIEELI